MAGQPPESPFVACYCPFPPPNLLHNALRRRLHRGLHRGLRYCGRRRWWLPACGRPRRGRCNHQLPALYRDGRPRAGDHRPQHHDTQHQDPLGARVRRQQVRAAAPRTRPAPHSAARPPPPLLPPPPPPPLAVLPAGLPAAEHALALPMSMRGRPDAHVCQAKLLTHVPLRTLPRCRSDKATCFQCARPLSSSRGGGHHSSARSRCVGAGAPHAPAVTATASQGRPQHTCRAPAVPVSVRQGRPDAPAALRQAANARTPPCPARPCSALCETCARVPRLHSNSSKCS